MGLAYERNTDLAFDTNILSSASTRYKEVSDKLSKLASELNRLLGELSASGWTTPAGSAFSEMVDEDWEKNIQKYTSLLDTLCDILEYASEQYDSLITDHIRTTKLTI